MSPVAKFVSIGGASLALLVYIALTHSHVPKLVGYGCQVEGELRTLYADAEDDLPRCAQIERN